MFNLAIAAADGSYHADIVSQAGIWSVPSFSPEIQNPDAEFPEGYLAYLRARDWESSIFGQYDLVVADRDGSNARTVFPEQGQPGMVGQEFVWNADGTQIALIYQGNLWVVDVTSGVAFPLTVDGGVTRIAWAG